MALMRQSLLGALLALLAAFIFGSGLWCVELASRAGWGSYAFSCVSAAIGSLAAGLLSLRHRQQRTPNVSDSDNALVGEARSFGQNLLQSWPSCRIGLVLLAANVSMFLALRWVEPQIVAFFAGLQVLWVALIELLRKNQAPNWGLGISILLCVFGTLFINDLLQIANNVCRFQLLDFSLGEFLALFTGFCLGLAVYLIRRSQELSIVGQGHSQNSPSRTTALFNLVIALGNLLIVALLSVYNGLRGESEIWQAAGFVGFQHWLPWLFPVLLGLGSFFGATLLQVHSQNYLSGTQVALLLTLQPLATIALGLRFFDSVLKFNQLIGGSILIVAAVISILATPNK